MQTEARQQSESSKENTKRPVASAGLGKKTKLDVEKEEARKKLERRLNYNAQSARTKPLSYKPYSGPLNPNNISNAKSTTTSEKK